MSIFELLMLGIVGITAVNYLADSGAPDWVALPIAVTAAASFVSGIITAFITVL